MFAPAGADNQDSHLLGPATVNLGHVLPLRIFRQVSESHEAWLESEQHAPDLAVSMLGDIDFCYLNAIRVSIRLIWLLPVSVVLLAIDHHHDVRFRFDRT